MVINSGCLYSAQCKWGWVGVRGWIALRHLHCAKYRKPKRLCR